MMLLPWSLRAMDWIFLNFEMKLWVVCISCQVNVKASTEVFALYTYLSASSPWDSLHSFFPHKMVFPLLEYIKYTFVWSTLISPESLMCSFTLYRTATKLKSNLPLYTFLLIYFYPSICHVKVFLKNVFTVVSPVVGIKWNISDAS